MATKTFHLMYPKHLEDEPVINQLLRKYTFTVNILRASIKEKEAWLDIKIIGKADEIESARTWLKALGIDIQPISE